jgi:pyrroloquinoline-quinone synthase
MERLWDRIEGARARWNVLSHPFYRRWSAGELDRAQLARYAGQYRHAVEAIAAVSEAIAEAAPQRPGLRSHAEEERRHVVLWTAFAAVAGGGVPAPATAETAECVRAWSSGDALERIAALYAIESGQPEISRVKRDGLLTWYGFTDGPATDYFRIHERRDAEHAAQARELVDELADPGDEHRLALAAEAAFRANWRLLDGVG